MDFNALSTIQGHLKMELLVTTVWVERFKLRGCRVRLRVEMLQVWRLGWETLDGEVEGAETTG